MQAIKYSIPFLFLAMVPLGFALGGPWSFLAVAVVPVGLAGLDWKFGAELLFQGGPDSLYYRMVPWLYIPLQIATIGWAATVVASPSTTFLECLGLTASVGLTAGIFGMLAAHEMVHSHSPSERALGLLMLASVGYMQFRIAHIHGHHVRAATHADSATARRGENAYHFIVRSVRGQLKEAWAFESARLRLRGQNIFAPSNRMLQYFALEGLIMLAMALLGLQALLFFLFQSAIAISLLELFNYVAHYGLTRRVLPSGRPEPLGPQHSWNSSRRMNNWSLLNMGRHSDHHRAPARHYQCLQALPQAPELPTGYAGAILLALVPPLWLRVMDPKAESWMRSSANVTEAW